MWILTKLHAALYSKHILIDAAGPILPHFLLKGEPAEHFGKTELSDQRPGGRVSSTTARDNWCGSPQSTDPWQIPAAFLIRAQQPPRQLATFRYTLLNSHQWSYTMLLIQGFNKPIPLQKLAQSTTSIPFSLLASIQLVLTKHLVYNGG